MMVWKMQTMNNLIRADAFSAARVISAVSAAHNEALSGKPSTIPAEAKARTTQTAVYTEALRFFKAQNPGKLSEETVNKMMWPFVVNKLCGILRVCLLLISEDA